MMLEAKIAHVKHFQSYDISDFLIIMIFSCDTGGNRIENLFQARQPMPWGRFFPWSPTRHCDGTIARNLPC
jgi:hypothetical protein